MTTLTNDALLAVAERLDVQTLPLVLSVGPQQDSYDAWLAARDRALADLDAAGVFDSDGDVEIGLAEALFVLAQPERELVARNYSPDGVVRVCVAYRNDKHAVAVRNGDDFELGLWWCDGSPEELARAILGALEPCVPAEVSGFSAPAVDLAERLDRAQDTSAYIDAMYALGVPARDASIFGAAFGSCRAFTEIVAYSHEDGQSTRAAGAVAVYDTERGRLVAAPTVSPDQQIWSTVTTGSDYRVAQAIAALLEGLPGGRWLTP
ncbi:ESX secretion-associated protein EspG [Nocardia sp. NPDC019395]|uniref:ESX secretion-associated protein EspG n=1 Tax=Nocardia sp. NPDC019395 TaxID=3154686 RepID=UPI0034037B57